MNAPLPHYRVTETQGGQSTVEIDLPDLTRAIITMKTQAVGTPAGDEMIRQAIARHEETRSQLREGF